MGRKCMSGDFFGWRQQSYIELNLPLHNYTIMYSNFAQTSGHAIVDSDKSAMI
jgi:hypothetical protein